MFFLSGTFGLDAWFIGDFGDNFSYKNDPPNNLQLKNVSFPSLQNVLSDKWINMKTKFHDLSTVFIKSRILRLFYGHQNGLNDEFSSDIDCQTKYEKDLTIIREITELELTANGIVDNTKEFIEKLKLDCLLKQYKAINVMPCSVLGSYLAQVCTVYCVLYCNNSLPFFVWIILICCIVCFRI